MSLISDRFLTFKKISLFKEKFLKDIELGQYLERVLVTHYTTMPNISKPRPLKRIGHLWQIKMSR